MFSRRRKRDERATNATTADTAAPDLAGDAATPAMAAEFISDEPGVSGQVTYQTEITILEVEESYESPAVGDSTVRAGEDEEQALAGLVTAREIQATRDELDELYSRNWAFITPATHRALRERVVLAVGAGLASTITTLACRTGFTRFIVADGDAVELSNLNRQAFSHAHIGRNKAEATAEILRAIHPDVAVETLPYFLDERSWAEPMARADLIISSFDWNNPAQFIFNRAAQTAGKPVLIPINLGWGGAVLLFTAESPSLESFIGFDPSVHSPQDVVKLVVARVFECAPSGLPPYLSDTFAAFLTQGDAWEYDPQLGVAAYATAALTVRAAVALVAGEPVRVVPEVLYTDVRVLGEPSTPSSARQNTEAVAAGAPERPAARR